MKKEFFFPFLILFLFFLNGRNSFSQNNGRIDSLTALLKTTRDTSRVRILIRLSSLLRQSDTKQSETYAREALTSAQKIKNNYFISHALTVLGNVFIIKGEYDSAIVFYRSALKLYEDKDYYGRSGSNNNIALCFFNKGNYKEAITYAFEGMRLNEIAKDTMGIIASDNTIANIYIVQKEFDKAFAYYNKNLGLVNKTSNSYLKGVILNNIGTVYAESAQYEKAVEFFLKAIEERKRDNDLKGLSGSMMNAGLMYKELKKTAESKKFLGEALALKIKVGDKNGVMVANTNLGDLYLSLGEHRKGLDYMLAAEKLLNENSGDDPKLTVYSGLASAYEAVGDKANALKYFKMKTAIKDTLLGFEKSKELANLQVKFETEKKEKENKILKQQNELKQLKLDEAKNRNLILFGGLALVVVVLAALSYAFVLRTKTNKMLSEQNSKINSQNNVLKTLNTQLIESEEKLTASNNTKEKLLSIISHDINSPLKAVGNYQRMLIENMGQLSESELKEAVKKMAGSHEPLEYLVDNLMHWIMLQREKMELQQEVFLLKPMADEISSLFSLQTENKKIRLVNEIDPEDKITTDKNLLSLVLRNLVANAIKFTAAGGAVRIIFDQEKKVLSVKDSGRGMNERTIRKILAGESVSSQDGTAGEAGTGLGLMLVTSSVKMMNARLEIFSEEGKGTEFRIGFKE